MIICLARCSFVWDWNGSREALRSRLRAQWRAERINSGCLAIVLRHVLASFCSGRRFRSLINWTQSALSPGDFFFFNRVSIDEISGQTPKEDQSQASSPCLSLQQVSQVSIFTGAWTRTGNLHSALVLSKWRLKNHNLIYSQINIKIKKK